MPRHPKLPVSDAPTRLPWWIENYRKAEYIHSYPELTEEVTAREVSFLIHALPIQPKDVIVDVCCAYGRHTVEFVRRGYRCIGVDRSEALLNEARSASPDADWLCADARHLPIFEADVVLNLFSSFGYFDDPAEDLAMLRSFATALRPGGRVCIDLFVRHPRLTVPTPPKVVDGASTRVTHHLEYNHQSKQLRRHTVTIDKLTGAVAERTSLVRLYSREELVAMLAAVGFAADRDYNGFSVEPFPADGRRLVVVGIRS